MKAFDVVRMAWQMSDQVTLQLIEDMRDAAMTSPTPRGGNHPLWVLGHLTVAEGQVPAVVLGESNPVEHWKPFFWIGSEPKADAKSYPAFEEVLSKYKELRDRNGRLLEELGDAGLDRATQAPPPGFEEIFKTVGQMFMALSLHRMHHRGQVADARRAAGRKPIFAPVG